jgi:hypothetical protein
MQLNGPNGQMDLENAMDVMERAHILFCKRQLGIGTFHLPHLDHFNDKTKRS